MHRLLLIVGFVGCGDNAIPHDRFEARSGDRIKLRWYAYDDGTRQWDPLAFQDTARDERCTVQRWSDGYTYCTPTAMPTVYSDPACTDEMGRWLATQQPPSYFFREYSLIGEDVVSRIYRRADGRSAPETTYELDHGNCVATTSTGWNYFVLGAEVPRETFARVRLLTAIGSERLGLDAYTTDDGLYVPVEHERPELFDRTLDDQCRVLDRPNQPTTICEPALVGEAEFSRDPACGSTDLLVTEASQPVPAVVAAETAGCKSYARRGSEIASVPVFLPIGDACVSVNVPADAHLFEIGGPFDIPVLERRHEETGHRLERILLTDGVTTVVDSLLFDTTLGVDCSRVFADAMYRCLPATSLAQVFPYFSDPTCVSPIELAFVETGDCDPATRFAIDQRGTEPSVRPLVAAYPGRIYEISTADTCLEYIPGGRQIAFTVGAAMAPQAFVGARVVVE